MNGNIAVIDIGSNSVRYMFVADGKILFKKSNTCQLARDKAGDYLNVISMRRTAQAVVSFVSDARSLNAKIYLFATAAVRNSINGGDFCALIKSECGVDIDVLSGEREALVALAGVLDEKDGLVLDIGGGSSEIIVRQNGNIKYLHSLSLGAVNLRDLSGISFDKARKIIKEKMGEYGDIPHSENCYAVGGTATTISACLQNLIEYDETKVHLSKIYKDDLKSLQVVLESTLPEDFIKGRCLGFKRAEVLPYGAIILSAIMDKLGLEFVTVSESDNLEGYLRLLK